MIAARTHDVLAPEPRGIEAAVCDTDGVITGSAKVHAAAWKTAFDTFLTEDPPEDPTRRRPFDYGDDCPRYVDGRSRLDGAAAFLTSRGPDPGSETVRVVAADKEPLFTERIREQGVEACPGTVRLVRALRAAGVPVAAASASRPARELLTGAGVLDLFEVLVDGGEAARLALAGKPQPDLFLEAARRLGVGPARAAVAEDGLAGVEAARSGGFALLVGVDRTVDPGRPDRVLRHGADIVVHDLGELLDEGARR
ncbi:MULTISPECIES: HAD family hydrolase [unclassified Streptomyces]|uniref:HAD family hydrolase n=1 Tax=unclassified Streptomyces TaxID=2593676 RepID=UPI0037F13F86